MPRSFPPSSLHQPLDTGRLAPARAASGVTQEDASDPWLLRNSIVLAATAAALLGLLAIALALAQPWMGVQLEVQGGMVRIVEVEPGSPAAAAGVPSRATLVALESSNGAHVLELEPSDLIEDPDLFPSYAQWGRFYKRQDEMARMLNSPALGLRVRADNGRESLHVVRPAPMRTLASLPFAFWFQLVVPAVGMIAAGWVLSVYPLQPATWFGGVSGVLLLVMVMAAAVFSTRELALPSALMHALSVTNHTASLLAKFCMAGVASFFPLRVGPSGGRALLVSFGIYLLAAMADGFWWLPSPNWGYRSMVIVACVVVAMQLRRQWLAAKGMERERAAVRAVAWPWLLGLGCLVGLQEVPMLLGFKPPLAQSWVVSSTLILSLGAAITLRSLRVFDLDDWALQLLLIWGAGVGVLACFQLIRSNGWVNEAVAMLASLVVFGLLYVPIANWIWRRVVARRGPSPRELTSGILVLGLSAPGDRTYYWADLLRQTFRARHIEWGSRSGAAATEAVAVVGGGAALSMPPVAGLPGMMLWHKERGARLFSRSDRRLAERLLELARRTIEARDAYGRGAAEERERIADDLHDDLGAKLLSLAHASTPHGDGGEVAALAREALDEMRLAVRNLKAQPSPVQELLADWRAENVARLRAAAIAVDWDAHANDDGLMIPARVSLHMTRVLREAVTNVIRHSGATRCRVAVAVGQGEIHLQVEDNGRGLGGAATPESSGLGLPSIERRARRLGGVHRFSTTGAGGAVVTVWVPLGPLEPKLRRASRL